MDECKAYCVEREVDYIEIVSGILTDVRIEISLKGQTGNYIELPIGELETFHSDMGIYIEQLKIELMQNLLSGDADEPT